MNVLCMHCDVLKSEVGKNKKIKNGTEKLANVQGLFFIHIMVVLQNIKKL